MSVRHIITVDGPSGTGKGTVSLLLAEALGWHYLDSGAIYRVLAYAAIAQRIDLTAVDLLVKLATLLDLSFEVCGHEAPRVLLSGEDVSALIRQEACGQAASKIAANPLIRQALLERQRDFAKAPGLVTDGRDMGTVVFPDAGLKIFLTASVDIRAERRYLQLKNQKNHASLAQVVEQLIERDKRDAARSCAPLMPAQDAIEVDTTHCTIEESLQVIFQLARERFGMI